MADTAPKISIDQLIDIVNNGGKVRTGVDIFNKYAHEDNLLQLILHAFVEAVGIYPPGSFVCELCCVAGEVICFTW